MEICSPMTMMASGLIEGVVSRGVGRRRFLRAFSFFFMRFFCSASGCRFARKAFPQNETNSKGVSWSCGSKENKAGPTSDSLSDSFLQKSNHQCDDVMLKSIGVGSSACSLR